MSEMATLHRHFAKSDDTIGMRRIHSGPEDRRHYCRMR